MEAKKPCKAMPRRAAVVVQAKLKGLAPKSTDIPDEGGGHFSSVS